MATSGLEIRGDCTTVNRFSSLRNASLYRGFVVKASLSRLIRLLAPTQQGLIIPQSLEMVEAQDCLTAHMQTGKMLNPASERACVHLYNSSTPSLLSLFVFQPRKPTAIKGSWLQCSKWLGQILVTTQQDGTQLGAMGSGRHGSFQPRNTWEFHSSQLACGSVNFFVSWQNGGPHQNRSALSSNSSFFRAGAGCNESIFDPTHRLVSCSDTNSARVCDVEKP